MSDSVLNVIATHVQMFIVKTPALDEAKHDSMGHALH